MITESRLKQLELISSFVKLAAFTGFIVFNIKCNDCQISSLSLLLLSLLFLLLLQSSQKAQLFSLENNTMSPIKKIMELIKTVFPSFLPLIIVSILLYIFIKFKDNINSIDVPPEFTKMSKINIILTFIQIIVAFVYLGEQFDKIRNLLKSSDSKDDNVEGNYLNKIKSIFMNNLSIITLLLFIFNSIFTGFSYIIISKFITNG
jgi:hypothetical protein